MSLLQKLFDRSTSKQVSIKEPPDLFQETQRVIAKLQAHYGSDFIAYWGANHSSMVQSDLVVLKEVLNGHPTSDRLYLFVKSSGGSGKVALRIIHLLRSIYREVIVLAPLECASAATMLALGADRIKMGPMSFLTAIDTSITHELSPLDADGDLVNVSQNELDRVIKLWNQEKPARLRHSGGRDKERNPYAALYKYVHPLVFGAVDRARSLAIQLTNEILSYHMEDEAKINAISHHLNAEYPEHGYPITSREAKKLGLEIEELEAPVDDLLIELSQLYSAMAQHCDTDFDEYKYHDNQIYTIIETAGTQMYYQRNKDMIWRVEDKQWISVNNRSGWRRRTGSGTDIFHVR